MSPVANEPQTERDRTTRLICSMESLTEQVHKLWELFNDLKGRQIVNLLVDNAERDNRLVNCERNIGRIERVLLWLIGVVIIEALGVGGGLLLHFLTR